MRAFQVCNCRSALVPPVAILRKLSRSHARNREPRASSAISVTKLLDEAVERDQRSDAEVKQRARDAVSLGAPSVLLDQGDGIGAPFEIAFLCRHSIRRMHKYVAAMVMVSSMRGQTSQMRISRRGKPRRWPKIPPDLASILDDAGVDEDCEGALIFPPTVE